MTPTIPLSDIAVRYGCSLYCHRDPRRTERYPKGRTEAWMELLKQYLPQCDRETKLQIGKAIAYGLDHSNGKRK